MTLISAASGAWCALHFGKYLEDRSVEAGTDSSAWHDARDRETGPNPIGSWTEGRLVADTSRLLERMRELRRVH